MTELPKQYDPKEVEPRVTKTWLDTKAFAATPDQQDNRYVVMMPLPNVTGALHMGHAMDNVMQDLLTRWRRMQGDNTLWMAGTDHAGIATQAVVEKRLKELEGKTRHDIGREALVERIWQWKDQYQARIVAQQQAMGCGCDWDRQRFTMDAMCARAVRHTFFKMFRDGLIYQGNRLVNWDCHLQTAVADDELYRETVHGKFYYLRYPVIDPQPGEPDHVVVATTRPETMLGDTAVACHGEPRTALEAALAAAKTKAAEAGDKDRAGADTEVERLEARIRDVLPQLEEFAAMARAGRKVMLPLMDREIPIIVDEWAKPELGTGCVKITPAHDPNDYDVWGRHKDHIDILNILAPDGTIAANGGTYAGRDRFAARKDIVADLDAKGLLDQVEDRDIEVDHSDRSKTIVEPYLSKQWFVRMADVDGGITMGRGTDKEFSSPGLAQAALDAVNGDWSSPTGRNVSFHPDPDRYRRVYDAWLAEKRDWCISRQLWWGHRIPVWRGTMATAKLRQIEPMLLPQLERDDVAAWVIAGEERLAPRNAMARLKEPDAPEQVDVQVCFLDEQHDTTAGPILSAAGLELDPDVLDTWFSSALWPHSTLGWPDPATAEVGEGQTSVAAADGRPSALDYYYPGSCLVTGRDIITLWVARMVITGLYNLGDVPFTDVFLHATILDGKGVRMSKSKGNGIDPVDIIDRYGADAMRYVVCELQTGTQDVRLPVQAISPFAEGEEQLIDLATAKPGKAQGTYVDPVTGKLFDLVGTMASEGVPQAKATSDRFKVGRDFCNKLFHAARFAFLNLEDTAFRPLTADELHTEDRWILSRLAAAITEVQGALSEYHPSRAVTTARDFFWNDVCDWYLELIKARMRDEGQAPIARQVLAVVLDQTLRLFHPFVPFITEELWRALGELAPERGIDSKLDVADILTRTPWPQARTDHRDESLEASVRTMQQLVSSVRETRARYGAAPKAPLEVRVRASGPMAEAIRATADLAQRIGFFEPLTVATDAEPTSDAATLAIGDGEAYVLGVVDPEEERKKLTKQLEKIEQQVQKLEKKLSNEGFVSKAPPEVVEKERQSLAGLKTRADSIRASLETLG